jgi:hypothetical protein
MPFQISSLAWVGASNFMNSPSKQSFEIAFQPEEGQWLPTKATIFKANIIKDNTFIFLSGKAAFVDGGLQVRSLSPGIVPEN